MEQITDQTAEQVCEQTPDADMQSLLAKETLALPEAQKVAQLTQTSKAQRDVFEQWLATQDEQLSQAAGQIGPRALATGLVLASAGRPHKAIQWLGKAPPGPQKSLALGICYLQTEQLEKALAELDTAGSCGADEFTVAISKVEALRQMGRLDEAQSLLEQYQGRWPAQQDPPLSATMGKTQADYWYQLGRLCEVRDQRQQALANYQKCLELQQDHQAAHFRLGYYSDLAGDDESALEHYQQCTSVWPVHVNALLNLAILYEDAEDYNQAEVCLRRILAADPNHARAKLYLKDVLSTKTMYYDEDQERLQDRRNQVLEIPVSDFELSVRSRNCLKSMGLNNLGDLLHVTEHDLLTYKNFGETSLREIKAILAQKGLLLGQMVAERQSGRGTTHDENAPEHLISSDGAMNVPLSEVAFSVRVRSCLEQLGAVTLADIVAYSEEELLKRKNFGQTSLEEVKLRLADHGLSLRQDKSGPDIPSP